MGSTGGWNRSTANQPTVKKGGAKAPSAIKGIIVGAIAVAVGVACILMFSGGENAPKAKVEKERGRIKEVTPAAAPTNKVATVKKSLSQDEKRLREIREIEDHFGTNMPAGLKTHLYYLKNPPKVSMQAKSPNDFFKHTSERQIAGTVFVDPGTFFLVQPTFDAQFDQDFINAMLDKIEVEDGDSDEVREKKRQMTELKKEIAAICKQEGRKPSEILNEHAKTMFELGRYKELLNEQIREIHDNPDMTDADVEDAFKAANVMLEKKGLPALNVPKLTRRAFKLQRLQERAARKAEKENNSSKEE